MEKRIYETSGVKRVSMDYDEWEAFKDKRNALIVLGGAIGFLFGVVFYAFAF